jgi:hypothetical protein
MVKLYSTLSPAEAENVLATVTVVNEEWLLVAFNRNSRIEERCGIPLSYKSSLAIGKRDFVPLLVVRDRLGFRRS